MTTLLLLLCSLCLASVHCLRCPKEFVRYIPSTFEEDWFSNIESYQTDLCNNIKRDRQMEKFKYWLSLSDKIEVDAKNGLICGDRRKSAENDKKGIFSMMEYRYKCDSLDNPLNGRLFNESIEPLVGTLRDPRPICHFKIDDNDGKPDLALKSFILFSNPKCNPDLFTGSGEKRDKNSGPRLFIADLGSTTYTWSNSGPSQSFLVNTYRAMGYGNLKRLMAWEAKPYHNHYKRVYPEVPNEVMPHYQFFNVPIDSVEGSKYNPLTMLKVLTRPEDFVVVKLDVDNSDIEFGLMKQILEDPEVTPLVDEFMFEHHSDIQEMRWAWSTQYHGSLKLGYDHFRRMREKGIRAHSWI